MKSQKPKPKPNIASLVKDLYKLTEESIGGAYNGNNNCVKKLSEQLKRYSKTVLKNYNSGEIDEVAAETLALLTTAMIRAINNPVKDPKIFFNNLAGKNDNQILGYVTTIIKWSSCKTGMNRAAKRNQFINLSIRKNIRKLITNKSVTLSNTQLTVTPQNTSAKRPRGPIYDSAFRLNHKLIRYQILYILNLEKRPVEVSLLVDKVRDSLALTKISESILKSNDGSDILPGLQDFYGIVKTPMQDIAQRVFQRLVSDVRWKKKALTRLQCFIEYKLYPKGSKPTLEIVAQKYHIVPQCVSNYCKEIVDKIKDLVQDESKEYNDVEMKSLVELICNLLVNYKLPEGIK